MNQYILRFDGASRGNPGLSSCGFVILDYKGDPLSNKDILYKKGMFLGYNITNNQAEYMGLFIGLKFIIDNKLNNIHIQGDSQLVIKQIKKESKVNNEVLKKIYEHIEYMMNKLNIISMRHIYRENNDIADSICNKILDEKTSRR
jgi:ribonuclease HI